MVLVLMSASCKSSTPKTVIDKEADVTINYILITTAFKDSKASRLAFQEKLTVTLDSLLHQDKALVNLTEEYALLEKAKNENKKALLIIEGTNEVDSTIAYRQKSLSLFKCFDSLYTYEYPKVLTIMQSLTGNKKELIFKILGPSTAQIKMKGTEMINASEILIKYKLNLIEIPQ